MFSQKFFLLALACLGCAPHLSQSGPLANKATQKKKTQGRILVSDSSSSSVTPEKQSSSSDKVWKSPSQEDNVSPLSNSKKKKSPQHLLSSDKVWKSPSQIQNVSLLSEEISSHSKSEKSSLSKHHPQNLSPYRIHLAMEQYPVWTFVEKRTAPLSEKKEIPKKEPLNDIVTLGDFFFP
jgi:hypothetical protein